MKKKMFLVTVSTLILAGAGLIRPSFADTLYVINVEGMTCQMCPAAIKKSISEVPGTESVFTSLENKIAVVVTKDGVKESSLLDAVQKAGKATGHAYKAKVAGEEHFKD